MKNSVSIITLAKYEHDFINQWLEHHINIGISHFYILIDNVRDIQSKYEINNIFNNYVTLIYVTKETIETYYGKFYLSNFPSTEHPSSYLHDMINKLVIDKKIINEDWVTAIGIDQFIYLNNTSSKTIQDVFSLIPPNCSQIFYPWSILAYNNENINFDNLTQNINSYKCRYGKVGHGNGIIRRRCLKQISSDSHHFISNEKQVVWILNESFSMKQTANTFDLFHIADQKMKLYDMKSSLNFTTFHFLIRNKLEVVIKTCFYWNDELYSIDKIANSIINKDRLLFKNNGRSGVGINTTNLIPDLYLPNTKIKNTDIFYVQLITDKLNKNGFDISTQEVRNWGNNLILV